MKIDLERPAGRRIMLLPTRPDYKPTRQKYPNALCLRDIVPVFRIFFVTFAPSLIADIAGRALPGRDTKGP